MAIFSQSNKQAFRNPWVIGWLGLLLLVLVVNTGMIITAFKTSPGLVQDDYYEQGRDYERTVLQLMEMRERLGWQISLDEGEVVTSSPATLDVVVKSKTGEPVEGLTGDLQLYRPSDRDQDSIVSLIEVGNGRYQARYTLLLKGVWDLILTLKSGDDLYKVEKRIKVL
ncbi:MAG: FixH family protein [Thiotrichales bacterium]|jgi:nitrogen fixation protein FixH|nr:FixH family protein [Thiotrichales bacterium]MBT3613802.1 FixH family protein [Thiotrichales bacterium]MBT3753242.1 FixH family protein [Thiotrichales bacterium]MBT3837853.1 FixH family protein [Thiotrichales bacterium]MBT4152094.1 FixH family protein [Thiotrichales bacterium]